MRPEQNTATRGSRTLGVNEQDLTRPIVARWIGDVTEMVMTSNTLPRLRRYGTRFVSAHQQRLALPGSLT